MQKFSVRLSVLLATFLLTQPALAAKSSSNTAFPLKPRTILDGTVTTAGASFAEGDVMIPLYGSTDAMLFADVTGSAVTNSGWYGSLGAGYRQIYGNYLSGAYVFGDYSRTTNGNGFWVLNPGVEMFSASWDTRINGYIPMSNSVVVNGPTVAGNVIGISKNVTFNNHQQYDHLYGLFEEMGQGLDTEVGYTFERANHTRVFGGAYFFNFNQAQPNNMNGAIAGVEMPVNKNITLVMRDSYDNVQKNTFAFTVRFTAAGMDKSGPNDVHNRMLDRIDRHLATLGTGIAIPAQRQFGDTGERILFRDNIAFFNPGGSTSTTLTADSCTFEHPCSPTIFNQTTVNTLNTVLPNTNFYLAPAQYLRAAPALALPHAHMLLAAEPANPNMITVNNGQSIFGRTDDFKIAGYFRNQFPVLNGSIDAAGNNTFQSFQLLNDGNQVQAMRVKNASNVAIDHMIVGNSQSLNKRYGTSLFFNGASNVSVTNSSIYGTSSPTLPDDLPVLPGEAGLAIAMTNSKEVYIANNTMTVDSSLENTNGVVIGVLANISQFTLNNNKMSLNLVLDEAQDVTAFGSVGLAAGVLALGSNTAITNNNFNLYVNGQINGAGVSSRMLTMGVAAGAIPEQLDPNQPIIFQGAGDSTVISSGNTFNQTATNTGRADNNYINVSNIGLLAASSNSNTVLTSSNDTFNIQGSAIIANGNNSVARINVGAGIAAASISGGRAQINTNNDVFNVVNSDQVTNANSIGAQMLSFGNANIIGLSMGAGSQVVINSQNDTFNLTNEEIAASPDAASNISRDYSILATTNTNGIVQVNVQNDLFNIRNVATASSSTFQDVASIGAYATTGAITVTAANNVFNQSNQATVNDPANPYTYEDIISVADAGGSTIVNSNKNQYKTVINNKNVGLIGVNSISAIALNNPSSVVKVTSQADAFTQNITAQGDNALIDVSAVVASSFDLNTSAVNVIAGKFDINAQAIGNNASAFVAGVASGPSSEAVINLSQNTAFNVSALQNGALVPGDQLHLISPFQMFSAGIINDDGTTVFNVIP